MRQRNRTIAGNGTQAGKREAYISPDSMQFESVVEEWIGMK
jgi:hypothetical protein